MRDPCAPVAIIDHAAEPAFFAAKILGCVSIRVKFTHTEPFTSPEHFVCIKNEQAVITRYETQDEVPTISFDMLVARLGDIAIANNPFELYLYYGQNIKARSKAQQTFLVQLSSGASLHAGYLPSPDGEKFGGYGGMIINGQVGSDGGFKLADTTVEEINKLFE